MYVCIYIHVCMYLNLRPVLLEKHINYCIGGEFPVEYKNKVSHKSIAHDSDIYTIFIFEIILFWYN